ncbi:AAA family ATPase [Rossellomorea marisflavi]|uniref:AAA family ATPase n=1 Tax=Rossellomorea marisflavi TaxID=189381 RepID=A0A5D4S2K9_9BACI|nr:AAA family ATPase [Rossellomorea marisflavi]TYS56344.1 AAA family ATPase [Rossellomorea marisflavi]
MKIALAGKMRSGKDTIAEFAVNTYGFKHFAFGDELKRHYHELFGEKESKPRSGYQWFGQVARSHDPDIWVDKCFQTLNGYEDNNIIITDLRQPNEYKKCKEEGFYIIKVHCDDDLRLQRILSKNDSFNPDDLNHETEQHIDSYKCEYVITNNGTLEELEQQFIDIFNEINK